MVLTRRSLLRLVSISLCGGIAGCSSALRSTPEPTGVRLSGITVLNREIEPHRIDVMVRNDKADEVVYWNRFDAPAASTEADSSDLASIGRTVWEDPVEEPGNYSVYADSDIETDATDSNWVTRDLPESGCMGIDVIVTREGQLRLQVYSQSCG